MAYGKSQLELRCEAIEFCDYPATGWVVYLGDSGDKDSAVLNEIQALNLSLQRSGDEEFVVHYANGGQTKPDDFIPISQKMDSNQELKFGSAYELSFGQKMPFFNIEYDDRDIIGAIDWPGRLSCVTERLIWEISLISIKLLESPN